MRKLIRDKVPEIIRKDGKEPILETCSEADFIPMLVEKLREEVDEFEKSLELYKWESIEELADINEVLVQLAYQIGSSPIQVMQAQSSKYEKRGGFYNRIIWKGNK